MDESVANPRSEANLRCCFLKRRFAAMAEKFRLTCWQNWNEWVSVYEKIYSFGDQEIQAEGLRLIDIWRSRSEGKIPLAIECTAGLVAADIGLGQTTRGLSLAMALVRFVNGMVDQVQKGLYARSVQSIADEIGIPDWLVDLRHESTHASLPSMQILEAGLGVALQWLKTNYWEKTFQSIDKSDSGAKEEFDAMLVEYMKVHSSTQKVKKKFLDSYDADVMRKLCSKDIIRTSFLPALLEAGILFPTKEQLIELNETDIALSIQTYADLWNPMLRWIMDKYDKFYVDFLISLLDHLEQNVVENYLKKFVHHILLRILEQLELTANDCGLLQRLFQHCVSNLSRETREIFIKIKDKLDLPEGLSSEFDRIFETAIAFERTLDLSSSGTKFGENNIADLISYFNKRPIKGIDIKIDDFDLEKQEKYAKSLQSWSTVDSVNWSLIPPGVYLNDFVEMTEENQCITPFMLPQEVDEEFYRLLQDTGDSEQGTFDAGDYNVAVNGALDGADCIENGNIVNSELRTDVADLKSISESIVLF